MTKSAAYPVFLWIARLEGISYLLLLLVAMPLKYLAGIPELVMWVGWAHGLLFVGYGASLLWIWQNEKWKFSKAFLAGMVSLVPAGTFWFEKKHLSS